MKFNCIRVDDIQTVVDKYKGKSESTVTTIKTILYQMYGYALKREIVEKNYAALVDYEWTNNKEKLHINFTSDEINILWGHQDTQHVDLVLMLIYTGFRVSEFLSLENKNVHLKERYIVGGMKTKAGIDRTVSINKKPLQTQGSQRVIFVLSQFSLCHFCQRSETGWIIYSHVC